MSVSVHRSPLSQELKELVERFSKENDDDGWQENNAGWLECLEADYVYLFTYQAPGLVAFAWVFDGTNSLYISYLFTAPAHRKQGIGSQLLTAVKEYAASHGKSSVTLLAEEAALVPLYEKNGFVTRSRFMRYMKYTIE
jgi:GNAT superfamily N-acetyltransferase